MSQLLVQERDIVIPGEALAEGLDYLPGENAYREENKIYSKVLGLVSLLNRVIKLTPLSGPYIPRDGDKIIGVIFDIAMSGWRIDTGTAYPAMLNVKDSTNRFVRRNEDLSKILAVGDYVVVKIVQVTSQKLIDVIMKEPGLYRLSGGRIIKIHNQKVPRVIGKQGSMISLIKDKTGCSITVGQNGLIWIKGTPESELLAEKAIRLIENRSHEDGLTDKVSVFLENNKVVIQDGI